MVWRAAALAFALLAAALPAQVQAGPAELTPAELRVMGYDLAAAGNAAAALEIAEALLARDPKDPAALLLRAQGLGLQADATGAREAARRAYRLSSDKNTRFSAAMFMATSLYSDKRKTAAQLWLRRAGEAAPSDRARDFAREEFAQVRSNNPLILSFDMSVRPTSNINNGSTERSYRNPGFIWERPDIPILGEQRALPGVMTSFSADLTYRLPPTATTRTELSLWLDQRLATLSPEALEIAPTARAKNYNSASVEAGVVRLYRPEGGKVTYRFAGFVGHDWSGGRDLADLVRLEVGADVKLSADWQVKLGYSAEKQARLDAAIRSNDVHGLAFGLTHRTGKGDLWRLTLTGRQTTSASPGLRNTAVAMRVNWAKAKPVAGIGISAAFGLEGRDYPTSPFSPLDGRQDRKITATLTLDLNNFDYMGFAPSLNLTGSDTRSNVDLFSGREFGINLGFKSNF